MRRGLVLLMAALRPFVYAANRTFATRVVYSVLRGISRDRLDLLGEEYFRYKLKPNLKPAGIRKLEELVMSGAQVVLVSQGLDHVIRPLAEHLGVTRILTNRMEFRDGIATGRLLDPVVRPRGVFARISSAGPDGLRSPQQLSDDLGVTDSGLLRTAVVSTTKDVGKPERPLVDFDGDRRDTPLSVRSALRGKHILLIGVTGFIGKVWLAKTLLDIP